MPAREVHGSVNLLGIYSSLNYYTLLLWYYVVKFIMIMVVSL